MKWIWFDLTTSLELKIPFVAYVTSSARWVCGPGCHGWLACWGPHLNQLHWQMGVERWDIRLRYPTEPGDSGNIWRNVFFSSRYTLNLKLSHTPEYPPWPLYVGLCWSAPWQPKLCVQHSFLRSWVVPSWRRIGLIPFSMHVAHRLGLCHCASLCDCGCMVGLQSRLDTSCLCLSVCTGQFGCSKPDGACASSCLGCPDF